MNRPGIICGMKAEARLLRQQPFVGIAGGRQRRAEEMARDFGPRATSIVSFGIAGALAPHLRPGDVVIATSVLAASGEKWLSDPALVEVLAGKLPGAHQGALLSVEAPIAHADEKAQLFEATGALACDMESLGAARGAEYAGLPFVAVRAIADPALRSLPRAALKGLGPDGSARPLAVMAALMSQPGDLPGLLSLARESRAALAALEPVARLLGRLG